MTISAKDVLEIHEVLTDWFADSEDPISPPGVRNMDLVESAVARPLQTIGGRDAYPTVFDKAAALFHSLINNHAFHNGNKRTALTTAQVFLDEYKLWIDSASDDDIFEFTRAAAAHELTSDRLGEIAFISHWFEDSTRKVIRGEHPLKYSALKDALTRFGFTIDPPEGNFLNIYREDTVVETIIKQGIQGFRPYHTDYIWSLRKRLGLVPESGVDSVLFYGGKGVQDVAAEFIELRIDVIRRLAKT